MCRFKVSLLWYKINRVRAIYEEVPKRFSEAAKDKIVYLSNRLVKVEFPEHNEYYVYTIRQDVYIKNLHNAVNDLRLEKINLLNSFNRIILKCDKDVSDEAAKEILRNLIKQIEETKIIFYDIRRGNAKPVQTYYGGV